MMTGFEIQNLADQAKILTADDARGANSLFGL